MRQKCVLVIIVMLGSALLLGSDIECQDLPTYRQVVPFSSSTIPYEWTCSEKDRAKALGNPELERRLLDIFSWRSFLSVNWPVRCAFLSRPFPFWEPKGTVPIRDKVLEPCVYNPKRTCEEDEEGKDINEVYNRRRGDVPRWMTWVESYELFPSPGRIFEPDDEKTTCGEIKIGRRSRLERIKPEGSEDLLFDRNGNPVYYEIFVNESEAKQINAQSLTTVAGQREYANTNLKLKLESGQCVPIGQYDFEGAIELKLAWKILKKPEDQPNRFLKRRVDLNDGPVKEGELCKLKDGKRSCEVGLVGMHIIHKTRDHPFWIWSTFEHIDNVPRSNKSDEMGRAWSFYNPTCSPSECLPNCPASAGKPAQLTRVEDINSKTEEINLEVQELLHEQESILQYYKLIGTQYVSPKPGCHEPQCADPPTLRNTVLEPYHADVDCPGMGKQASTCVGCHKNAQIPSPKCVPTGEHHDADMSFLLDRVVCENSPGN